MSRPAVKLVQAIPRNTGTTKTRHRYSLADKISIVRESMQPGITQASIARKHGLSKNLLTGWRKALKTLAEHTAVDVQAGENQEVIELQRKIAELERQLGRKTFEIELLRQRLDGAELNANGKG